MTALGRLALGGNLKDRGKCCLQQPSHLTTNAGIRKGGHWPIIATIAGTAIERSNEPFRTAIPMDHQACLSVSGRPLQAERTQS